jgi:hypothetical protein
MTKFRIYVKRSTIQEYEIDAATAEEAEKRARDFLENNYYLSDSYTNDDGEEVESPFESIGYGDDSEEEFISVEEA